MPSLHIPLQTSIQSFLGLPGDHKSSQCSDSPSPETWDLECAQTQHDVRPAGAHHFQTFRRVSLHEMRQVLSRDLQQQNQRGHNVELCQGNGSSQIRDC